MKFPVDPELVKEYRQKFGLLPKKNELSMSNVNLNNNTDVNNKPTMQDIQKKMDNKSNIVRMNNNQNDNNSNKKSETLISNQPTSKLEYKLDVNVPKNKRVVIEDVHEISIDLSKHKTINDNNNNNNIQTPLPIPSNEFESKTKDDDKNVILPS